MLNKRLRYGEPIPVADGILWLRARLPLALNHVNLWLCDDGDGWTVVDTGYGDAASRAMWHGVLGAVLAGRPVRRVLVTHFHPDHAGLAGWLCGATGAELWMSRTEWLTCRALALDTTPAFVAATERRLPARRPCPKRSSRASRRAATPIAPSSASRRPCSRRLVAGQEIEHGRQHAGGC